MKSYIQISRIPYEEPYHLDLIVEASNGEISGKLEYYCNTSDLAEIGKALIKFPSKMPDEYNYIKGSENFDDRCAYFFKLKAYTINSTGHCAVQLRMNNNSKCPDEQMCEFSILAEVADINRLGDLLVNFSRLKHSYLIWNVIEGELK